MQILLRVRKREKYEFSGIAKINQTRSSFITDDGKIYDTTKSKYFCCKSGQLGLDKRLSTVFADGILHIRPLLIFHGQGLHIKNSKKEKWDKSCSSIVKECLV